MATVTSFLVVLLAAGVAFGQSLGALNTGAPGLTVEQLQAGIAAGKAAADACWQEARAARPTQGGGVTLAWRVEKSGRVAEVTVVESTATSPPLERCLTDVVRQLVFPRSGAPTPVRHVFGQAAQVKMPPASDVAVEPGAAKGTLDREIIRRVIRQHLVEIKRCYERSLARAGGLTGSVTVQFTIAATGGVTAAAVQRSTLGYPAVEQCVVAALRTWQFPRPQGGGSVVVSYPFGFHVAGQE